MPLFEYKVVPAPAKGTKAKGVKTPEARFANSVEITLNEMAAEGWEYLRAELLPSEERTGLTSSTTNWRNVLVFRRTIEQTVDEVPAEPAVAAPVTEEAAPVAEPETRAEPPMTAEAEEVSIAGDPEASPDAKAVPGAGAVRMLKDDGVEEISPVAGFTAALRRRASQQTEDGS